MSHQQEPKNPYFDVFNLSLIDRDLLLSQINNCIDRDFKEHEGCWRWIGNLDPIKFKDTMIKPKLAMMLCHGFKLTKQDIIFRCDIHSDCVNPQHLRVATLEKNSFLKTKFVGTKAYKKLRKRSG